MLSSLFLLALLQTPPAGPVVQMFTPSTASVQLFADGTVVLPPLPVGTVVRIPPQDSNDVALKFNQFGRKVCALAKVTPALQTILNEEKITCP